MDFVGLFLVALLILGRICFAMSKRTQGKRYAWAIFVAGTALLTWINIVTFRDFQKCIEIKKYTAASFATLGNMVLSCVVLLICYLVGLLCKTRH